MIEKLNVVARKALIDYKCINLKRILECEQPNEDSAIRTQLHHIHCLCLQVVAFVGLISDKPNECDNLKTQTVAYQLHITPVSTTNATSCVTELQFTSAS